MNFLRILQGLLAAAVLALSAAAPAQATPSAAEDKVIQALIQRVASYKSMKFMRNGEEHDATEAAKHLSAKYEHFKKEIVTAEDFIRLCGTRSEMSKRPYKVRIANNAPRNASDFLNDELRQVRRQQAKA